MTPALLITLRETLEASLVVGIVLTFLHRSHRERYDAVAWLGVFAGVIGSVITAWIFHLTLGGFEGTAEQIYEGITMLAASALITWMILWMAVQGKHMKRNIESRMEAHLERDYALGIFFVTFFSVLREGVETVIFLRAAFLQSVSAAHSLGAILGVVIAIGASWLLFKGMHLFSFRKFFNISGVFLILFASGLVAHGIHELQEARIIPIVIEHLWNTSAVISEEGTVGGFLKGVFGYNADPSLFEVMGYVLYIGIIGVIWKRIQRQTHQV